jgi:hypothetical protein
MMNEMMNETFRDKANETIVNETNETIVNKTNETIVNETNETILIVFPQESSGSLKLTISNIDQLLEAYRLRRKNFICDKTSVYVQVAGLVEDISRLRKERNDLKYLNDAAFTLVH